MALAKKCELLYGLRPDVAVIPECSRESMLACEREGFHTRWWGENKHKGLGVLAAKPWSLEDVYRRRRQPRQRWIAPVRVRGPRDFLLLAVWACPVGTVRENNYVGQTYEAIVRHPRWFCADTPTVICGDFNSNVIFDAGRKKRKHSAIVRLLGDRGAVSAYHAFFAEEQGKETRPTHYLLFREQRPFHLDYIFVPKEWRVTDFQVGTYEDWRAFSDHVPILVDVRDAD